MDIGYGFDEEVDAGALKHFEGCRRVLVLDGLPFIFGATYGHFDEARVIFKHFC